jgi:hypothetical protein
MELSALAPTLIERLLKLENAAAHATVILGLSGSMAGHFHSCWRDRAVRQSLK